jgi:hypothetical protein
MGSIVMRADGSSFFAGTGGAIFPCFSGWVITMKIFWQTQASSTF